MAPHSIGDMYELDEGGRIRCVVKAESLDGGQQCISILTNDTGMLTQARAARRQTAPC